MHVVALLAESGGGRGPSQPCAYDDDRVFAAVSRIDQLHLEAHLSHCCSIGPDGIFASNILVPFSEVSLPSPRPEPIRNLQTR